MLSERVCVLWSEHRWLLVQTRGREKGWLPRRDQPFLEVGRFRSGEWAWWSYWNLWFGRLMHKWISIVFGINIGCESIQSFSITFSSAQVSTEQTWASEDHKGQATHPQEAVITEFCSSSTHLLSGLSCVGGSDLCSCIPSWETERFRDLARLAPGPWQSSQHKSWRCWHFCWARVILFFCWILWRPRLQRQFTEFSRRFVEK